MSKSQAGSRIPAPTVARLPVYFRCLAQLRDRNVKIVSSGDIAAFAGIKASQFRKDLSYFGEFGIQGLGYPVEDLLKCITSIMKLDRKRRVVLLGAGNLGSALCNFPGFARWGFDIVHLFDSSPHKVGTEISGHTVQDIAQLPCALDVELAILAVPSEAAQSCAELLTRSGIKAILNFTGRSLVAPPGTVVRNVNLTHELAILAYDLSGEPDLNPHP
ncbi:MAG: redox-sensing transcriptional repressor Rex [Vulcanimicrobiota bacterium]